MSGVNKAILIGNLGRDPESRQTQSGDTVVTLNLATSESWRDRATGERKERTEWHRVVIFNQALGKVATDWLRKGAKVYIAGQLRTRKWQDQSGTDRWTTEIVLGPFNSELVLLDKRDGAGPVQDYEGPGRGERPQPEPGTAGADLDDEIPF